MKLSAKRIVSFLLSIIMIATIGVQVPVVASAEDTVATLSYSISGGVAMITGIAEEGNIIRIPAEYEGVPVAKFSAGGASFFQSSKIITEYSVDENNQYFSNDEYGVLYNHDKTELLCYPQASSATIFESPATVETVGDYAFQGAINLTEINFSEGLKAIGRNAFWSSSKLTQISLPEGLLTIAYSAFYGCNKLESISLPKSLQEIESNAFRDCNSITSFFVDSENVMFTSDENGVLYNKDKTVLYNYPAKGADTEYIVPSSVTSVNNAAFANTSKLKSVVFEGSITQIGDSVFQNSSVESVTLPEGLTSIPGYTFDGCKNLSSILVPNTVTSIGVSAFRNCTSLSEIDLPDGITEIGSEAFRFSTIESISLPGSLTVIESSLFHYCRNLKSVEIPESVTTIKTALYYGNDSLTDIYYHGSEEQWNTIDIDDGNTYFDTVNIHYNYGKSSGNCGETLDWSFDEDSKVLSITGSGEMDSLASFEEYGWSYFKDQIEVVEFGNAAVSVGSNAFYGCPNLKEVYLSESIGTIGENAFADCPLLSLVTVSGAGFTADETSFSGNDERLVFLCSSANTQAADYAEEKLIKSITFSYDHTKEVMNFNDELTVYSDLPYTFLSKFVKQNPGMEYLYFEKLVFHGVEPEMIDINDLNNEASAQYLTFNKLYVSLKKVKDGSAEGVTFEAFLTLLENGDYDSFMFELVSQEGKQQLTFEELWEKVTDHFVTSALRITSKIINFFRKIFR